MVLFNPSRTAALVSLAAFAACAASPAMRAAERGDRVLLRADLVARERRGDVSRSEAASLARVVAEREIGTSASGDALDRVVDVRPCARELDGALADRMRIHDAAGAEAALARIEAHDLDPADARRFADDPDPRWRAVGVRGLVRPSDRDERRRMLVDPDPGVRRQATRASRDAADPADLVDLAETARVDPAPIVRTEAVRAIAALPVADGGRTADVLRDLWVGGDDGLREDIAIAWERPALWASGGRDALRYVVATQHGPASIDAAAAILRHRDADDDVRGLAAARLVSAIGMGSRVTRLQAIAEAPLDRPDIVAAVRAAATGDDPVIRVGALARFAASDAHAASELEAYADPSSPFGARARMALAVAGDKRVQAWIERELASSSDEDRLDAAIALGALGVSGRAAPLLADDSGRVRARVACTILMDARRSGF